MPFVSSFVFVVNPLTVQSGGSRRIPRNARKTGIFKTLVIINKMSITFGLPDKYNETATIDALKIVYDFMLKSIALNVPVVSYSANARLKTGFKELPSNIPLLVFPNEKQQKRLSLSQTRSHLMLRMFKRPGKHSYITGR